MCQKKKRRKLRTTEGIKDRQETRSMWMFEGSNSVVISCIVERFIYENPPDFSLIDL